MAENNFPENLIKGRIAETVFELMFRDGSEFEIFPLGYEHITPILRHYHDHPNQEHKDIIQKVLNNYDGSPDFLLTNRDKSKIYLVEVKYRSEYTDYDILKIAEEINTRWQPCKIFLASPNRFYYDSCKNIIINHGNITPLSQHLIPPDKQKFYHDLLMRFEKK